MIQYKIGPGSDAGPGLPLKLWMILILFGIIPFFIHACDLSPKRGGYYDTQAEILKIDDVHDELHLMFEFVGIRCIEKIGVSREIMSFLRSRYENRQVVEMTIFVQENSVGCTYTAQIYIDKVAITKLECLQFRMVDNFNLKDHIHKLRDKFDRESKSIIKNKKDNTL
jgi:hypothetical protein